MLLGILVFIITIAFLVLIHELGHFSVAKLFGVRVEEFAFGFPPKLWSKKKGETEYSFNLLPLGGFCRLYGEDGKHQKNNRSYGSKTWWQKLLIGAAGVLANFVFAALLLMIAYNIGVPRLVSDYSKFSGVQTTYQIIVADVEKDSIAKQAGFKSNDIITAIDDDKIENVEELKAKLNSLANQQAEITVKRDNQEKDFEVLLKPEDGNVTLGVILVENPIYKFGFFKSIWIGIRETGMLIGYITASIYLLIKELISSGKVSEAVAGPVGIYYAASGVSKLGLIYVLQLIAYLSVNLGIINILPVPALDGGRIIFNIIEGIRRKPLDPRIENTIHSIGFILLMILIILIFYRDIGRIDYYKSIFN